MSGHLIAYPGTAYNAEPPLERLGTTYLTPQADLFVRCHGTVPSLAGQDYGIEIRTLSGATHSVPLADLRSRFPSRTVVAALQCAGNRRAGMQAFRPTSGDPWRGGAMGNAEWGGVSLADVLRTVAGDLGGVTDIGFRCHDRIGDESPERFAISIPLDKALHPDTILAFAINGEELTPEHGFPLRVVVPGYAGVRNAKWLATIELRDRPVETVTQQHDYKLFPPDVTKETVDWEKGRTINDMPVTSAICEPADGAKLPSGRYVVRGYAWANGEAVGAVELSADGGRTWQPATREASPESRWGWTLWHAEVELPTGRHELVVRAADGRGQTQPSEPDGIWNFRGYLNNVWHRVVVDVG